MMNDQNASNKYDPEKHNEFVSCPRSNCRSRNAPPNSEEFKPECWKCGQHLGIQSVSHGEEYTIDITDIHQTGAGVGHTDDGFVILVEGQLPEKRIKVRVTNVKDTFAWGEHIETVSEEIPSEEENEETEKDETESDDQDDDTVRLGSRGNHWG